MPGLGDGAVNEDVVYGSGPTHAFYGGVVGGRASGEDLEVVVERA